MPWRFGEIEPYNYDHTSLKNVPREHFEGLKYHTYSPSLPDSVDSWTLRRITK